MTRSSLMFLSLCFITFVVPLSTLHMQEKPLKARKKDVRKKAISMKSNVTKTCTANDLRLFYNHYGKKGHEMFSVLPQVQKAYGTANYAKAIQLIQKLTPEGCMDIIVPGFPPTISYSKLQRCIRKSQGVTPGCASCFPNYMQSMIGKGGMLSPSSCMNRCSKMTPNSVRCLGQIATNPLAGKACLTDQVQKHTLPCLQCSKMKLIRYANCMNFGFNPEMQLTTVLTAIKKGPDEAVTRLVKRVTKKVGVPMTELATATKDAAPVEAKPLPREAKPLPHEAKPLPHAPFANIPLPHLGSPFANLGAPFMKNFSANLPKLAATLKFPSMLSETVQTKSTPANSATNLSNPSSTTANDVPFNGNASFGIDPEDEENQNDKESLVISGASAKTTSSNGLIDEGNLKNDANSEYAEDEEDLADQDDQEDQESLIVSESARASAKSASSNGLIDEGNQENDADSEYSEDEEDLVDANDTGNATAEDANGSEDEKDEDANEEEEEDDDEETEEEEKEEKEEKKSGDGNN